MTTRQWWAAAVAGGLLASAPLAQSQDDAEVNRMWHEAHQAFGQAEQKKSGWDDVRQKLQEIIARAPTHYFAHEHMARSYENESNKSAAQEWWVKTSDINPDHITAAVFAGMGFIRYQKYENALPYLQRAQAALEKGTVGPLRSDDETRVAQLVMPGAIVETLWLTGKKDDAVKMAAEGIKKSPYFPSLAYYLGQRAEEEGNTKRAVECYKRALDQGLDEAAKKKLQDECGHANHNWGLQDRRNESAARANYIASHDKWLEMQVPRYGEIKNGGMTFADSLTGFQVDLPPAKALKLKKDERYPWVFWFEVSHEVKPGSINTHVIDILWHQADFQDVDVQVRAQAAPFSTSMTVRTGGSVKWDQPEKVAEAMLKDECDLDYVGVKNVQQPKKAKFGRGVDAFATSFEGQEKQALENYNKFVSQGQKPKEEPPVWEVHCWTMKGKSQTFFLTVKTRPGIWKARQKEIDLLLKFIKIPS